MTCPVESRKRRPDLWKAYDLASEMDVALTDAVSVRVEYLSHRTSYSVEELSDFFSRMRTLLRERIEADAKEVGR